MNKPRFSLAPLAACVLAVSASGLASAQTAAPAAAGVEALQRRIEQMAAELSMLRAELDALKQRQPPAKAAAPATAAAPAAAPAPVAAAPAHPAEPDTVITSYGEINYNRPRDGKSAQTDLRRFVLGFQHRFDDKTKLVTEVEVEHAIASADDAGEVEIEQAYVERQLSPAWALRAGLFLMPIGLLNENHEPTAYYGVERNFVETAIIPSTWREGGLQAVGSFGNGITVQFGASTGFDLNKWDAAGTEGRESPLGAIHQELQLARSRNLAVFGAVNWRGLPGLALGGGVFSGGATQGQTATSSRVTLWDLHARWTPGAWDLSALYARGTISNTAALNLPLVGNPTLIPASFDGGYLQAAYKLWSQGDMAFSPFVRWERFNTARRYADLGAGLTPDAAAAERVYTLGANFHVAQGIVLKADVQKFKSSRELDRVNLGLGWSF
jgi:hypothetical protein